MSDARSGEMKVKQRLILQSPQKRGDWGSYVLSEPLVIGQPSVNRIPGGIHIHTLDIRYDPAGLLRERAKVGLSEGQESVQPLVEG